MPERQAFERELVALVLRYGGSDDGSLVQLVRGAVDQLLEALEQSQGEGQNLTPEVIVRIRLGKFVAARLPPQLYRDASQLTSLRGELGALAQRYFAREATG